MNTNAPGLSAVARLAAKNGSGTRLAMLALDRAARQAAGGAIVGADGRYVLPGICQTSSHAAVSRIGQGRHAFAGREADPCNDAGPCASCDARRQGLCSTLGDHDLKRLAEAATVCRAAPGRTFITEGEPSDSFYSVRTGTVRLFRSLPDGRRQITGFAGSGHFLGLAVTGPLPGTYAFSAEAIGATQYCRFPRQRLRAVLDDFPALERRLLELACGELAAAQTQMLLLGRKSARERVASFLLARCHGSCAAEGSVQVLHLPMTRTDIADYLGLTIETVCRTLTRFRTERIILIPNSSDIVVLRLQDMATLADGSA